MSTTLPLFWHLSSASKKERIDASVKLIGALEHFQSQFTDKAVPATAPENEDDDDEDVGKSNDTLDLLNAQDVSYSIRRLIRGLASPRESSRLGFAVTLTELLSRLDTVTCPQILGLITDTTRQHGSMNGQEERDILFARLFGAMSVIQSGLAVRTTQLPSLSCSTTFASSAESYEEIIQLLVALGDQKSWLRESAWFTVSLAVDVLNDSDAPWKGEAVAKTLDTLFVKHTVWSIEKLALAVKLQDFYPTHDWRSYLPPNFKDADILSTGNLSTITRIMKESSSDGEETKDLLKAPSGCWKPQLNFSWNIILDQVLPSPNSKVTKGSFQDFYRIVVDETLFSSTSSVSRKYWGFQVFQKALKKVDQESMPMLFTKNFMRTWINHLSKKDRHLHKISLQTATEVQTFVKDKPHLGFSLILQLTGVNGSQNFDKLTKTKTVESILSSLDAKGVQSYIDYLFSQVNEPDVSSANVTAINARRAWVIEQLAALVRNYRLPREDNWVKNALDWLAIHGLFVITKRSSKSPFTALRTIPNPVFSDELRETCREKLLLCLGDLNRQAAVIHEGDSKNKIQGAASDGEYWISKVFSTIQDLEGDSKHVVPADEVDKRERALRVKAREIIARVKTTSTAQQEDAKGAELLLIGSLLNRYCAEDDEEHSDSDTLEICIEGVSKLLFADDQKSKSMRSQDDAEGAEPEPVDLLVDTIIDFLERGTSYLRTLGIQVFSLLSGSIKESTVDLIVTQLERRDVSKVEEEGMEGDKEDEDGASEKSDSEKNSEESNPENPDEGSDGGETDLELRREVEEALRVDGIELTTGGTDSEEDELMDDEQMMAIDERLAEVFRSRANEKKKANGVDAQREATHFKNRVLDLVGVYLRKQHSNPLALRFITPLSMLVIGSGQDERQLADKAKGILRSRIGKTKEIPVGVNPSHVVEISTTIHALAQKARSSDILAILGLCSIYLVKIAIQVKEDSFIDLYKQDLLDFTTRKNSGLNGTFFQEFIKRYPSYAWRMRQDFLDSTSKTINAYRQIQVIQLLQLLLNLLPSYNPSNDEVMTFMASLKQQLLELAENACKDSGSLTTAQMKELLSLVLSSVRQTARIAPTMAWKSEEWRSLSDKLKNSPRFKTSPVLEKLCKRIVHACETPGSEASGRQSKKAGSSKRKAEDVEAEAEEEDVPHKNKKQRHKNAKAD